jgi:hypothetical protein
MRKEKNNSQFTEKKRTEKVRNIPVGVRIRKNRCHYYSKELQVQNK